MRLEEYNVLGFTLDFFPFKEEFIAFFVVMLVFLEAWNSYALHNSTLILDDNNSFTFFLTSPVQTKLIHLG